MRNRNDAYYCWSGAIRPIARINREDINRLVCLGPGFAYTILKAAIMRSLLGQVHTVQLSETNHHFGYLGVQFGTVTPRCAEDCQVLFESLPKLSEDFLKLSEASQKLSALYGSFPKLFRSFKQLCGSFSHAFQMLCDAFQKL